MFNTYQSQWYAKKLKNARPIDDYIKFIELMKLIKSKQGDFRI